MAANSHRPGSSYGGAAPYRSSDGLSTRAVGASEEIQLRIDPMDLDDEITGLHRQVRRLKHVAEEIGTEVKYQKDFLEQLDEEAKQALGRGVDCGVEGGGYSDFGRSGHGSSRRCP